MFKSYDDFDEMFADMRRAEEVAIANILPFQREIVYGSYWMRYWPQGDLLIFGYVYTLEENWDSCINAGGDKEECAYERDHELDSYSRGYRFGRAYSVVEPTGELGSTHISEMIPITKEQFEEAKALNWSADDIAHLNWFQDAIVKAVSGNHG